MSTNARTYVFYEIILITINKEHHDRNSLSRFTYDYRFTNFIHITKNIFHKFAIHNESKGQFLLLLALISYNKSEIIQYFHLIQQVVLHLFRKDEPS